MNALFWPRFVSSVVPVLLLLAPGVLIVSIKRERDAIHYIARVILWSLSVCVLATFLLAAVHLSVLWYLPILFITLLVGLVNIARKNIRSGLHKQVAFLWAIGLVIYLLFSIPFFYIQQGLPAGDSQKSIYWANQILATTSLPNYESSINELSRDPVDFFTPGLHSLTAFVMAASPLPLTTVGFLSIALGIAAVGVALAISKILFAKEFTWPLACLTAFFILTQYRFLRYFSEPGYHLQNIVGEVLLFGSLYIGLSFLKRWRWDNSILLALLLLSLALTHQFSAFISAFMLLPVAFMFVVSKLEWRRETLLRQVSAPLVAVILVAGVALSLGLQKKIPHFFTTTPHLLSSVPVLLDYPKLMGLPWLVAGMAGLVLILVLAIRSWKKRKVALSFSLSILVLIALSQGPRIFIDIPAVRALLYLAIPLSITGSYLIGQFFLKFKNLHSLSTRILSTAVLSIVVAGIGYSSLTQAFAFSHATRTDSSLTPELKSLNSTLPTEPGHGGILTDDYNQQQTSWLILAGKPMYTRASSDLSQQMSEASQSQLRYQLFLDQLDFEKIFELGSLPIITQIMDKHNIEWVTGISKSSEDAFEHNPSLVKDKQVDGVTLFRDVDKVVSEKIGSPLPWLLRASTLANDIGDSEDTFEHLYASVRADRLSEPQFDGQKTYRTTTAPFIPLEFNVNNYVRALWDKDMTGQADSTLEFEIRLTNKPSSLLAVTSNGKKFQIIDQDATIRIPAEDAAIDSNGFVTITLENPTQQSVGIDLIALGLGQIP